MGPCPKDIFNNLHISPMLSRPKPNASRRIIVDLSWPKGHSVNSAIEDNCFDDQDYILKYTSVDDILKDINRIGKDAYLFKIDISRAFRNLRLDPKDYDVMGVTHKQQVFIDLSVAFGIKTGSALCERVTDILRDIMTSRGCAVHNYIDDVIGVDAKNDAQLSFATLKALFCYLGIPINPDKLEPPSQWLICMGIMVDVEKGQISIPEDKLLEIKNICNQWASKTFATRRQLQSLLGRLLYIHKCVVPAWLFVNRMLQVMRNTPIGQKIWLTEKFHQDLRWFNKFLLNYNGKVVMDINHPSMDVFVDASLSGVGAKWNENVYASGYPNSFCNNLTIVHFEVHILVALRLWAHCWAHTKIHIFCDNLAVVNTLNSGRIQDEFLMACARILWAIAAQHDITLIYSHIYGINNKYVDCLSRWGKRVDNQIVRELNQCNWWTVPDHYFYPDLSI